MEYPRAAVKLSSVDQSAVTKRLEITHLAHLVYFREITRAYCGMEGKIGMEYGMAEVWNGRFDVWNGTNLPYSIQIPYLHILTWCC